jgi:hypothetical protein
MEAKEDPRQQSTDVFEVALEEIYTRIGKKVREDSEKRGSLTSLFALDALTPEPELMKIEVNLVEMVLDERYKDIKFAVTPAGNTYVYSETYITKEDADILAQNEEYGAVIAEKIRDNSKRQAKLTSIDSFISPDIENKTEQVEQLRTALEELSADERYLDIKPTPVPNKGNYYYSDRYITANYAEILARTEANDPCMQIAATVRNDSKLYPRPTNVLFFTDPVFGLGPEKLDVYIDELLAKPEYGDIKLVRASNGAGYLYSDLYLTEAMVKADAEWNEVGRWDSP